MSQDELKIKISTDVKLDQLREMESSLQRQIVQLRALGDAGSDALKKLERNLGMVRTELGNVGRVEKFNAALGETFRSIPVVGTAMSALNGTTGLVGGAFVAGTYAIAQFRASLNFADQLQDTSEQLNVSASSLQALNAHFGDAGVKSAAVTQVILKLKQSMAEAASGSEVMRAAFASLGLDVTALRALSLDEALSRVGSAMRNHADAAVAAAAAQDILGRGTGRLANALKDLGGQGLSAVKDNMTAAGRVLSDADVKRLADANQNLEEFQQRVTVMSGTVAGSAMKAADKATSGPAGFWETLLEGMASATDNSRGVPSLRGEKVDPRVAALRAASAQIAADAKAEADRKAAEEVRAGAAAEVRAAALKPIQEKQAALDEKMLAQHTARLAVADQILIAEAELTRLRSLMPAEDDASIEAARKRVELGEKTLGQEELLGALRKEQKAEADKARADEDEWLERIYAAEAARITARQKEREQARDQDLARRLSAGDAGVGALDQSRLLLNDRRDEEKLRIYAAQRAALAELLALREREQAANPTPEGQRQIDELRAKDTGIALAQDDLRTRGAGEGGMEGLVGYLNTIPDAAGRARDAVMSVAQAMETGISSSLTGLINQTMTWTEALANIGTSIVQSIIASFVRMAAQWITQQIIMAVFGRAIQAAQLAALAPMAAASAALWAPAATAASIATYGGAAVQGAVMAKTAIISSAVGYAEGGLVSGPGTSTSDSIPAWLSTGEYVIPAERVKEYGAGFFDDLRAGRTPELAAGPAAAGGASTQGAAAPGLTMHQAFFFDREEAMRSALTSPAGRRIFTDLLRQTQHEL